VDGECQKFATVTLKAFGATMMWFDLRDFVLSRGIFVKLRGVYRFNAELHCDVVV